MIKDITIRPEEAGDVEAISRVTEIAFRTLAVSQHTEQFIIAALRGGGVLSVSLVAEVGGRVVGHAAFSPITMEDGTSGWFGLGPVSVLPEYQRQGIGTRLIEQGMTMLKQGGARGCCVVGHPEYYVRFGFGRPDGLYLEGVPPEVFFAVTFKGCMPRGAVHFHEAFGATGTTGATGDQSGH